MAAPIPSATMPSSWALSSSSAVGTDANAGRLAVGGRGRDREVEAERQAREPEEDPQPPAEVRAEQLERHREKGDPGRRHERKDAVDPERDQRPARP